MATIIDLRNDQASAINGELAVDANGAEPLELSRAAARPDFWRGAAPRRLRTRGAASDEAWKLYWKHRRDRPSVAELCRTRRTPLAWAAPSERLSTACAALLEVAQKVDRRRDGRPGDNAEREQSESVLCLWMTEARSETDAWRRGVGCLAATHALARIGPDVAACLGWELLDFLYATALRFNSCSIGSDVTADEAASQQLLAGELPLTMSYLFPEMSLLKALRPAARARLSEGLEELLNGDGLVRAQRLGAMRRLAACWTRCRAIGGRVKQGAWTEAADRQYAALVRQAVRWSDAEGRPLLAGANAAPWDPDCLCAALRLGGGKPDLAAAKIMMPAKLTANLSPPPTLKPPKPSYHCEWSTLAVLRCQWSRMSPVVAVDYSAVDMKLDVRVGRQRLFAGVWAAEPQLNGQKLAPDGVWEELCWFTDRDVDYLELRLMLEGGVRLERQILLARRDQFLLLADHLQGDQRAELRHAWELPLAAGVEFRGEAETRDGLLAAAGPLARVMPLALPEWRIDSRVGALSAADGRLRLDEQGHVRAVACPLFVDLDVRRSQKPCTWRQLTVAESLAILPADMAVGYRIQSGKDQWLVYRSQGPRGNRTVLGQNTSSEFLAARFLPKTGKIKDLLEIEG